MTRHRLTNSALAVISAALFAAVLSTSYLLDGPSELQAARDTAASVADAQRMARRDLCGSENASVEPLPDGGVQCRTKRGHKTIMARGVL